MHRIAIFVFLFVAIAGLFIVPAVGWPLTAGTEDGQLDNALRLPFITGGLPVVIPEAGGTIRVSVEMNGAQADDISRDPSISAEGRFVAFGSDAGNLVPGDTNHLGDVFVRDRLIGTTIRVSVSSAGAQSNNYSWDPSISADGRLVAFPSTADNLVEGDNNYLGDIFVHNRQTGATTLVSVNSAGVQANNYSWDPAISADGRFVAFVSEASNLAPGDSNGAPDVFVHDRHTGATTLVSVSLTGESGNFRSLGPATSADGRLVAFMSDADNLIPDDTNGSSDVFVHDRQTGATTRVSVNSAGEQANDRFETPSISADGRFVTLWSSATNLVPGDTNEKDDIFVHDRHTGVTTRVSVDSAGKQANYESFQSHISADGRFVVFASWADNLVPGDTNRAVDVFVHERETGVTTRVTIDSAGAQANGDSFKPSISADNRFVVFESSAANLVPNDTNSKVDIFVHDRSYTGR